MLRVFFDGLCEPKNPGGVACYGFVVYDKSAVGERKVFEGYGVAAEPGPDSTHNVAEYTGLIRSIEWVLANQTDKGLEILGDSQLVIRQLTGEYKVRSPESLLSMSWPFRFCKRLNGPPSGYLARKILSLMNSPRSHTENIA